MFKALGNLNVLGILRVGLAGLCFLLSLLAFRLIQREQDRASSPRKGILRAIYIFMGINLLTAVLVATAAYLGPRQPDVSTAADLGAKTYMTDTLSYLVDLTAWTEQTHGPVKITRSDSIRKVSDTHDPYVVPYYTTGDRIDAKFLSYASREPDFDNPTEQPGFTGKHYLYKIAIGDEPKNFTEFVSTLFTFPNGFTNPASEWWEASVAYPSKTVSVVIRFPDNKPCARIKVYKIAGIGEKQPLTENEPVVSNEKVIVTWVGLNVEANTRIHFEWDW
jgi:hypothetical protein